MTTDKVHPIFLTPDDLVERYRGKISRRTFANWRSNHEGPKFTKVGGRVLYRLENVLEWEQKRTRAA